MRRLLSLVLLWPVASLEAQQSWYVVKIAGSPVGWTRETRIVTDTGVVVRGTMSLTLNRLGSRLTMETTRASIETMGGSLRSLDMQSRLSEQTVTTSVAIDGLQARVTTRTGGRAFTTNAALRDTLLGPDAVRRLSLARLRAVGDSIQYGSWDADANVPAVVTRVLVGRDSTFRILERSSASPVQLTLWLDRGGRLVRSELDLPFGHAESILADSAAAMATGGGGALPDESYAKTLARTQIKLPRARDVTFVRLALSLDDSSSVMPDLSGAGQRVVERSARRIVLEVTKRVPRVRATFPVAPTPAIREYLEPNAYVQSDEPALVAQAKRIVGAERDLFTAALAIERWVSDNMKLDLGVAFAPSTEVFDRRRGTCVAYATLVAALTRAVGIPSRIAMGYVYVNGMFGGHAWPEVLVGDDWIPIDAAVVADGAADAARFAFAWSSLASGPGSLAGGAAATLYGRLAVSIREFATGATHRRVPPDATAYVVDRNSYRNDWLGIRLTAPDGFQFTHLDETWPSTTVLGFERGAERVRVRSVARVPWEKPPAGDTIIPNGLEYWVIEVESPNAAALIARVRRALGAR